MLLLLDILLTILHIVVTLFNITGWMFRKTRRLHLVIIALTFASWFILGFWYGFGYCFLTDWHWDIKRQRGITDLPASFIKFAADKISGRNISPSLVNTVTLAIFIATILLTIYVNFINKPRNKHFY